jgi:glycosyltransferase involved in cell wall biosynthesis
MAEWVAVTLESCLQQSHKELEILILDDGSTDAGPDIARAYAALGSRIRVTSQPNAGLGGARLSGPDDHYEKRLIDLGFALFDGLAPDWFRVAALAPEVKEQTDFLPLAQAMNRRDQEAVQGILENLRRTAVSASDKRNVFHTIRHNLKSVLNPLAWNARKHLRTLESLSAKRKGIPRVAPGSVARPAR